MTDAYGTFIFDLLSKRIDNTYHFVIWRHVAPNFSFIDFTREYNMPQPPTPPAARRRDLRAHVIAPSRQSTHRNNITNLKYKDKRRKHN